MFVMLCAALPFEPDVAAGAVPAVKALVLAVDACALITAQNDNNVIAIGAGLIGHHFKQIQNDTSTPFDLHGSNAFGGADADRLRAFRQLAFGGGQVERNACGVVDGKTRRIAQRAVAHLKGYLYLVAGQTGKIDCLERIHWLRISCLAAVQKLNSTRSQAASISPCLKRLCASCALRNTGFHVVSFAFIVFLSSYSLSASAAWRSIHPPRPSGTISVTPNSDSVTLMILP